MNRKLTLKYLRIFTTIKYITKKVDIFFIKYREYKIKLYLPREMLINNCNV